MAAKNGASEWLIASVLIDTDECIEWPFSTMAKRGGYGHACIGTKHIAAHRYVCIITYGEPPPGRYHAAHSCRNPRCVNKRHLRWATPAENNKDKYEHGTNLFGTKASGSKLTDDDIRSIRGFPMDRSHSSIARIFGVGRKCIANVRIRKTWTHIE